MTGLYVFLGLIIIAIHFYVSKEFEAVAADKGYSGSKYFCLVFFTGIYGCLLIVALPDRINRGASSSASSIGSSPDMPAL